MDMLLSKIIAKHLAETKGTSTDALDGGTTTIEQMAKMVWEQGYPAFRDVFANRIQLPKGITTHVVPVPALGTDLVAEPTAGDVTVITNTYKNVVASQVSGVNYGWDRSYLETATWDALQVHLKEAGRVIEEAVFKKAYAHLLADCDAGNKATYTSTLDYAEFLSGVALVAGDDFEADVCICPVAEYFELLNDEKFINASYMGSADPIRTGKIQTTVGVTVFSSTLATAGKILFFDSKKALCMAVIRDRKVEEYAYPDANLYGFVATMKFGDEVILPKAIAVLSEV